MSEPVPSSYQPPVHLKLYDGIIDPQNHTDAFKNAMLIFDDSDAMHCKAFLATLSEAVQQWFSFLPPNRLEISPSSSRNFLTISLLVMPIEKLRVASTTLTKEILNLLKTSLEDLIEKLPK